MFDVVVVFFIFVCAITYIVNTVKREVNGGKCVNCEGKCGGCEAVLSIKNKLKYIASKRAMLESEMILVKFVEEIALKKYSLAKILKLTEFLDKTDDLTLMEYVFQKKEPPQIFSEFVNDIRRVKR